MAMMIHMHSMAMMQQQQQSPQIMPLPPPPTQVPVPVRQPQAQVQMQAQPAMQPQQQQQQHPFMVLPKAPSEVLLNPQHTARMDDDPNGVPNLLREEEQDENDAYAEGVGDEPQDNYGR